MFKPAPEEARLTQAIEIAAAAAPAAADRRGYRREIDGLRAVAVLPVMLFHAGFAAFAGGWLGVDVFFVISGYLITGILARELAEGRFSIARFYERRARRILPALVLVLLACVPFALALMSPPALEGFSASFLATVLSVSNVWFWTVLDYFGPAADHLPLLHTWTLGVEEQFYLLFPPILALLWRWRRGSPVVPLALLAALSLGLAVWAASRYPSAGFFLLPFRGWELATGALLALAATPGRARGAPAALGLALIVAAIALAPRLPGVAPIVLAVAGSGLVIRYAVPGTAAARLLSHPALVGIGLISYSAYLWHQPVLVFARLRFGDALPPAALLALGGLALLLAWPTWAFVERPFRRRGAGGPARPLAVAAGTIVLMSAVGLAGVLTHGLATAKPAAVRAILASVTDVNPHRGACKTDLDQANPPHPVAACLVDGTAPAVAFIGDSHADAMQGAVWDAFAERGFRFYTVTRSACPPIPGLTRTGAAASPACDAFVRGVEAYLDDGGFPVVVLAARWISGVAEDAFDNGEGGADGPPGDWLTPIGAHPATPQARADAVVAAYVAGIEALLAKGKKVVLVYPVPEAGWNVPEELARRREASPVPVRLSTDYQAYLRRQAPILAAFDAIESEHLFRVRPSDILCDKDLPGRCINNLGDRPLYYDSNHLNNFGAALIAPAIADQAAAARATP